jgi:hypothetical protein
MLSRRFWKRVLLWFSLFLFLVNVETNIALTFSAYNGDLLLPPKPAWPPLGQKVILPVTRDTWISSADGERTGSNGGAKKLKLKGRLEYVLIDIDPSVLKGKIITGTLLHVRSLSFEKDPLARVGVSSIASRWVEGNSKGYRPQIGSSCFLQAEHDKRNWAYPGSTLMDVVFGRGHTIWKFAECSLPNRSGWQVCAVDPDVVAARVAGLSEGFCLFDEVGNEWSIKKGKFEYHYFPNRFLYSKESGDSAPWLEIWVKGSDSVPPEPVQNIKVEMEGMPPGEAIISWDTPKDRGGGKTLGFIVTYDNGREKHSFPRYLIPMAGFAGDSVRMHIHDLPFQGGESITLTIRPVDNAGNIGPPFKETLRFSSNIAVKDIPASQFMLFKPNTNLPEVGGLSVAVVDLLDKIDPRTGRMIPDHPEGYKGGNHIFSAHKKLLRLQGARNETVHFQINLAGQAKNIDINYSFDHFPLLKPRIFQFAYVRATDKKGKQNSVLPDPLLPLKGSFSIPSNAGRVFIPDQKNLSLICETYIPHQVSPGIKRGHLSIMVGNEKITFEVALTVWKFTLPNKLSFIPEMNAYGTASPYNGYDYYRLAHEHRTCLNRLPYGWGGAPDFAPRWSGVDFNWSKWDSKVGPLLDGSAFSDQPRRNEPVDVFYLPFNENWPVDVFKYYSPSYWADEAFNPVYEKTLKNAFERFAGHCARKQWSDTIFQFYLNNKVYFRKNYPESSAPWVFDEPINTQDFWALHWYGLLWKKAVEPFRKGVNMWYRGDISYGQFGRNTLWGIMDVEYIGDNNDQKTRMKHDQQMLHRNAYFAEYGTANRIEASNLQPVLWCLSAWSKGTMGVLPWQTIGSKNCWKHAEQTALFYPHPSGPIPSVRLKAFTRGQQDVEYLELFCKYFNVPKFAAAGWLKKMIDLGGEVHKSRIGDAGTAKFDEINPIHLWQMNCALGEILSRKGPKYQRSIASLTQPRFNVSRLPDIGYSRIAPKIESRKPDCERFKPGK